MYTKQSKKFLILNILDILRKYTDKDHRLNQKDIIDILKKEYGMTADRKAVKRNIMDLIEFGYDIEYTETLRMVKDLKTGNMEESYIMSDYYIRREFDDSELRLLIDSLVFSRHISYNQCKDIINKLENLSNVYFRSKTKHISIIPKDKTDNKQIFFNIELLDKAISKKVKVMFKYVEYGTDKQIHPKKCLDGTDRIYIVSPYQMVAKDGKYYLICNYDKYDDISNYRIDRIVDIKILDDKIKPFETLEGAKGKKLNLEEYMKEHIYMFSSDNTHVKFWTTKDMISDVIDIFGKDVSFSNEDENGVVVKAYTNEKSMEQFAKIYAPDVIILEPESLSSKIRNSMEETISKYEEKGVL